MAAELNKAGAYTRYAILSVVAPVGLFLILFVVFVLFRPFIFGTDHSYKREQKFFSAHEQALNRLIDMAKDCPGGNFRAVEERTGVECSKAISRTLRQIGLTELERFQTTRSNDFVGHIDIFTGLWGLCSSDDNGPCIYTAIKWCSPGYDCKAPIDAAMNPLHHAKYKEQPLGAEPGWWYARVTW